MPSIFLLGASASFHPTLVFCSCEDEKSITGGDGNLRFHQGAERLAFLNFFDCELLLLEFDNLAFTERRVAAHNSHPLPISSISLSDRRADHLAILLMAEYFNDADFTDCLFFFYHRRAADNFFREPFAQVINNVKSPYGHAVLLGRFNRASFDWGVEANDHRWRRSRS